MDEKIFTLFNVSIENYTFVSATVFLLIEAIKGKFPTVFVGGWKTVLLSLVISFLLSFYLYNPDWIATAALTVFAWLLPAGLHNRLKNS